MFSATAISSTKVVACQFYMLALTGCQNNSKLYYKLNFDDLNKAVWNSSFTSSIKHKAGKVKKIA